MHIMHSTVSYKRSLRLSLTMLSVVALVGSLFGAISGFTFAEPAAATTSTGGIRDTSGAVEKADQKASDLPAGSCVVASSEPEGSQAGFSWKTMEPSATKP